MNIMQSANCAIKLSMKFISMIEDIGRIGIITLEIQLLGANDNE